MWEDPVEQEGEVLNSETLRPSEAQQQAMLRMARQAITDWLVDGRRPHFESDDPFFSYRAGVFVTLREKPGRGGGPGRLRGCIGHTQPDQPLIQIVPEMAIQAATADPRFAPMKPKELDGVTIDIAILSPIRPVAGREEINVGEHGLVLTGDYQRALLLPKSPIIYGWDLDQYLANLHRKAGLPVNYWPDQGRLYVFTSFDFGE